MKAMQKRYDAAYKVKEVVEHIKNKNSDLIS
jgi:hypothetical protein